MAPPAGLKQTGLVFIACLCSLHEHLSFICVAEGDTNRTGLKLESLEWTKESNTAYYSVEKLSSEEQSLSKATVQSQSEGSSHIYNTSSHMRGLRNDSHKREIRESRQDKRMEARTSLTSAGSVSTTGADAISTDHHDVTQSTMTSSDSARGSSRNGQLSLDKNTHDRWKPISDGHSDSEPEITGTTFETNSRLKHPDLRHSGAKRPLDLTMEKFRKLPTRGLDLETSFIDRASLGQSSQTSSTTKGRRREAPLGRQIDNNIYLNNIQEAKDKIRWQKVKMSTEADIPRTVTDHLTDWNKPSMHRQKVSPVTTSEETISPTLDPFPSFTENTAEEFPSVTFSAPSFTTPGEDEGHVTFAANHSVYTIPPRPSRMNVTSLLDTLMKGYDKILRPGFGGPALIVKADIEIRSMGPISERDMIYSMDCYFRQVWTDRRLSFNASTERVTNVSLNVKMLERIWRPDTIFINGGPSYVHTITTPNKFFRLSHDGTILYSQRLTIKASCPMHLEKFPMDTQKCPLHIASFGYSVRDVIYEWHYGNDLAAVASNDMRLSQFDLKGMPACNMTRMFKGTQHSILTVYFDFRRHTGYFLIQVYVPCCLLVVLSWVSFWINREATSDRISLGATTMLTMTFLVLDSRNDLPKVAYSTALDVYVFMCFCFIFASIVQFAAVHFFTKYGTAESEIMVIPDSEDEDDDDEDEFESCETPDDNHNSGLKPDSLTACLRKMWRCLMSARSRRFNKNVRNALGLNSVSKIDKVARVLFPAVYCGLNVVYWMSYW